MSYIEATDYFRDNGDGTFFVTEFWILEKDGIDKLFMATTLMEWKDVSLVQRWANPSAIPENVTPEGDKCLIYWAGREMKLLAAFDKVSKAWLKNRHTPHFTPLGTN
jgi:hypothetical protein